VTDDGSSDGTDAALRDWARAHRHVSLSIISHPRAAGQSAAIHSAVHAASAPIIVTLDGDGQNPPDQIPKLLAPFLGAPNSRLGLVAGQRMKREDTLSKRVASRLANRLRGALLRDGTRDTGCGLKVFRRDAYLALPYFNHMHRFLPALFQRDGWTIAHIDVTHAPRRTGTSKYNNLSRALVGAVDLIGVVWLMRRGKRIAPDETTVTRGAEL
ncbi:MAG: glycosyltransferase family 2 protein, partial [Pseudomonadota bacterium]